MTPPDSCVPLAHYSAALNEIYLLRTACAYEAMANRATQDMRLPAAARALYAPIDAALLAAARGQARSGSVGSDVCFDRSGWETQRRLRHSPETDPSHLVDEPSYLNALAEIHALRVVLGASADQMPHLLAFRTFPPSRRRIVESQIARMRSAASGQVWAYYGHTTTAVLKRALREAGAPDSLTRAQFEAEPAGAR